MMVEVLRPDALREEHEFLTFDVVAGRLGLTVREVARRCAQPGRWVRLWSFGGSVWMVEARDLSRLTDEKAPGAS